MQAGRLRHRATIQSLVAGSPAYSSSGESLAEWTEIVTVWASVEPLSGRELFAAQEHNSAVSVRIRIRYRSGIDAKMRVLHEGRYYEVLAVLDPDTRHRELELLTSEGIVFDG